MDINFILAQPLAFRVNDYILDSNADVDMNVIGTSDGMLVEVQGTGEEATYSRTQMDALMDMAEIGLSKLYQLQKDALQGKI